MRPGKLRHVCKLYRRDTTQNALGQRVPTWILIASNIRANVEVLGGRELELAKRLAAEATVRVTTRHSDASNKDRFVYDGQNLEIETRAPNSKATEFIYLCKVTT